MRYKEKRNEYDLDWRKEKNMIARFSISITAAAFTAFVCGAQGPVASLISVQA